MQPARRSNSPSPSKPESNVGGSEDIQKVEVEEACIRRRKKRPVFISPPSLDNRILFYSVIPTRGRSIRELRLVQKLPEGFRNAIRRTPRRRKGEGFLIKTFLRITSSLQKAITKACLLTWISREAHDFAEMLVDLDLAKAMGSGRSASRHQTGTMEFMAII